MVAAASAGAETGFDAAPSNQQSAGLHAWHLHKCKLMTYPGSEKTDATPPG